MGTTKIYAQMILWSYEYLNYSTIILLYQTMHEYFLFHNGAVVNLVGGYLGHVHTTPNDTLFI